MKYVKERDGTWTMILPNTKLGTLEITSHQKRTFTPLGVAYLGWEWEDRVPPILLQIEGHDFEVKGYTNDEYIFEMTKRFLTAVDDGTIREGDYGSDNG